MQVIHLQHVPNVCVFHMPFHFPAKWLKFWTTKMLRMQGGDRAKRTHKDVKTWSNALGPSPYINSSKQPSRLSCNNFYQSSGKKGTPGPSVESSSLLSVSMYNLPVCHGAGPNNWSFVSWIEGVLMWTGLLRYLSKIFQEIQKLKIELVKRILGFWSDLRWLSRLCSGDVAQNGQCTAEDPSAGRSFLRMSVFGTRHCFVWEFRPPPPHVMLHHVFST